MFTYLFTGDTEIIIIYIVNFLDNFSSKINNDLSENTHQILSGNSVFTHFQT